VPRRGVVMCSMHRKATEGKTKLTGRKRKRWSVAGI
jgi:hypothetical protein